MRKAVDQKHGYALDVVIFPNDQMDKFNEYMKVYGNMPDKQILREMLRVKGEVSSEVLQKHIKDLDAFKNMEGFVTPAHKQRIDAIKQLLSTQASPGAGQKLAVETQFWAGSSLLLWFLTLAAIWRRPYWRY